MLPDNSLLFTGNWSGTGTAITASGNSTVVDLTGAGVGNAPAMIGGFPALNTAMGYDIGNGDGEAIPYLYISAPVVGTGAGTLTIALQAAPDNGSYSPGTYTTFWTSAAVVGTSFVAGAKIMLPVPPLPQLSAYSPVFPRFYRLAYTVASTISATLIAGLVINPPSSLVLQQVPSNFLAA